MTSIAADRRAEGTWWRRNRVWLIATAVLAPTAFYLPWRINQRELDRGAPRHAVIASATWTAYEGARWRLVSMQRDVARPGSAADYEHPEATRIRINYEVIPGRDASPQRLDLCKGRLVDSSGREWEANAPSKLATWMVHQGIGGTCGSRVVPDVAEATPGTPFAFSHVFLVPAQVRLEELHADLFLPPSTTRPRMGTYLRFDLPTPTR